MQRRRIGRGGRGGEEREKGAQAGRKRKEEGCGHEGKLGRTGGGANRS